MDEAMRQSLARQITGLPEPKQPEGQFPRMVRALADFSELRGRAPAHNAQDPSEAWLGSWLETQRAAERSGDLPRVRSDLLKDLLGPDWAHRA
ncbi:helicase associated domain-containing protein [Sinomonas susongensis]|uniref:helicase associated domain-containing protein n=1 Tax=Sinomonas susongensis TaxID=1324851 RepID=UPI001107BB9B|nr:helicase associated domain-containing protein [Sinomonas susongensis]